MSETNETLRVDSEKTVFIFKMKRKFTSWEYQNFMEVIERFSKNLSGDLTNLFLILPPDIDVKVVALGKNKPQRVKQAKRMIRIENEKG